MIAPPSARPGGIWVVLVLCPGGLEHGGGIGRQMGYFLRAAAAEGAGPEYRIVDPRGPLFLGSSPFFIGISVFYLAGAILRVLAARASKRMTIAHVNITGRGSTIRKIILTAAMRAAGMRYLLHVHDYDYSGELLRRGAVMKRVIRATFRGAEEIIVLGGAERRRLAEALEMPEQRLTVLHNAVPDPRNERAAWGANRDAAHLVFLGHMSERKGVSELLRALGGLELRSRAWRATIAGGGDIAKYRKLAADLGIASRLDFPGWLEAPAVQALCAESAVLLLPSHAEGLAMALLEGLSHGMAVIATPVGAHAEVVEDGLSGLFVEPGDEAALVRAICRVLDDEALRTRLQSGSRARFLERFEIGTYARTLGSMHSALLSPLRPRGLRNRPGALPLDPAGA